MMKVPYFIPWLSKQDERNVAKVFRQRWLTNGPHLKKFEKKIGNFIGSKYSIGVGSATHALHLSVKSLDIGTGDEVIVPTFTFAATANAVTYCGAEPVLVDVDLDTFNIKPTEIEKKITKRTKAIIIVHYGGQACDMDQIQAISKKHGLIIIEDCAHALGSSFKNKKCGNIGSAGCFSFYPTKIITTGEGGMITTNNSKVYRRAQILRSQGMNVTAVEREKKGQWWYDIVELGYNYRLDEIRASLGISQFDRVNEINRRRIKLAQKYNKKIKKIPGLTIPKTKTNRNHIFHLYTIKIEKNYHLTRDELIKKLHKNGIGSSVQYYPLHLMSYNRKKYGSKNKQFPNANTLKDQVLCLPIFPQMSEKQLNYVVSKLN